MFDLTATDTDCICAISTPPGVGGISVIRVSGERSFEFSKALCAFLPAKPESHRVYYGFATQISGEKIDEVLVTYFSKGRSFTGEESCEISCHGSPVIAESLVQELIRAGARLAKPGEFTCRAFFNGRIDLVQAESVLALIESQNKQASRLALRQLEGELSFEYKKIEDTFLWVLAQIEAGIDFSTEGLDVVAYGQIFARLDLCKHDVEELLRSYEAGRIIRDGLSVALVGKPNVGKSSLLNALIKEDRAIVTDEPGTTRDLVSATLNLGGVKIELVDTAGIREASNKGEKIGIQKSLDMMNKADIVLQIVEAGEKPEFSGTVCYNKVDLHPGFTAGKDEFALSAKTGSGLSELKRWLGQMASTKTSDIQLVVSQARHFELLSKIHASLNSAIKLIKDDLSPEFVAQELQIGIRSIHELLGIAFDEQVIDRIFKEFCLGK